MFYIKICFRAQERAQEVAHKRGATAHKSFQRLGAQERAQNAHKNAHNHAHKHASESINT